MTRRNGDTEKRGNGEAEKRSPRLRVSASPRHVSCVFLLTAYCLLLTRNVFAEDLKLQDLVDEAIKNNHDIIVAESRVAASEHRIPQAKSLPDPMFMFGYQNEGFKRFNLGKSEDAQLMFGASQMFPFPGKLSLKGEMAARDSEALRASYIGIRLKTIEKIKELYFDLFYVYKSIDLIRERTALFSRIEDAALSRYSSGMGPEQEILMAQTEKYMLLEKEEMLKQKIQSGEAMLNLTVGRDINFPLGRPVEQEGTPLDTSMDEFFTIHVEHSPFVKEKEEMVAAAETRVKMAKKEYYPDLTLAANYFRRGGELEDMWSLTTTVNIPLYYRTKQKQAVLEAEASLAEAEHELWGMKSMLSSTIRDNFTMVKTAERLMELYRDGLMPKTHQDFESALAGYRTGKIEAITVITRLKALLDYETLYWGQFVEREKAIARLESITGISGKY